MPAPSACETAAPRHRLRLHQLFWKTSERLHNLQFRAEQLVLQQPAWRWLHPLIKILRLPQWRLSPSLDHEIRPAEFILRRQNRAFTLEPASPGDNELALLARHEIEDPLLAQECLIRFQDPIAIDPASFALIRHRRHLLKHACFLGTPDRYKNFADLSYTRFRLAHLHARPIPRAIFFHYPWSSNYFHFHIDVLPQLRLLREIPEFDSWPLITKRDLWEKPYFHAILKRIGLAEAEWIVPAEDECLEVQELILARGNALTIPGLSHLQQLLHLQGNPEANRRLYLQRAPGTTRPLHNQNEIREFLRARHFEIVDTAQLPYTEQVDLFAQCRWLIAEHGAGLTNILYRKGAPLSLLELFPPNGTTHPCYHRLAHEIGATHFSLPGLLHPDQENAYHIPLDRLEEALHRLFQETP